MPKRLRFPRALWAPLDALGRGRAAALAALMAMFAVPAAAYPSIAARPGPAAAEQPALWVVSDADTTIYLFGTFHALDERTDWLARDIRAAFDSSDELVLETLVPSDPLELINSLQRHSLVAPMVAGSPVVGTSRGSFGASAGQAIAAGRSVGLTPERGADAVLRRLADAEGKPVDGLESFDFQLDMFASLPPAGPVGRTAATTMVEPDAGRLLIDMRSAWKRGDGSQFQAVLGSLEAQSPVTYQRLFVDRNNHWAGWIAERMGRPGTVFVAVGTGHLIGRDSVQQKLASRGYTTIRIH